MYISLEESIKCFCINLELIIALSTPILDLDWGFMVVRLCCVLPRVAVSINILGQL